MPVNKKHFIQLEDHFTDRLCEYQSFQLNRANYGLLPFRKGEAVSGDFSITELVTGTLEVRLKRCLALTAGGYLIDYDAGGDDELTASFHIAIDETEDKDQRCLLERLEARKTKSPFVDIKQPEIVFHADEVLNAEVSDENAEECLESEEFPRYL